MFHQKFASADLIQVFNLARHSAAPGDSAPDRRAAHMTVAHIFDPLLGSNLGGFKIFTENMEKTWLCTVLSKPGLVNINKASKSHGPVQWGFSQLLNYQSARGYTELYHGQYGIIGDYH